MYRAKRMALLVYGALTTGRSKIFRATASRLLVSYEVDIRSKSAIIVCMSKQLHKSFIDILAMPHYANAASSGKRRYDSHEEALCGVFESNGYKRIEQFSMGTNRNGKTVKLLTYPKLKKKALLKAVASPDKQAELELLCGDMPPGTYIHQPAGSQSFPDFLIRDFSGTFIVIEAKSGAGAGPVWNDSLPKAGAVYIMSSGKHNASTVWLGEDWISTEESAIFEQLYRDIAQLVTKANASLVALNTHQRGFQYYARNKHQQAGSQEYTDPFQHPMRAACEAHVLTFALEQ